MKQNAIIYCRVSDPGQVKNGNGLSSQETRCREYAKYRRYKVVQAFHEEGITGALVQRPRMQEMLNFLRQHKRQQTHIVIIDDINRLARDLRAHIELRTMISNAGGKLESPSIEFGENSDSRLIEHILATVAAHQREKNAEQVVNRMRARMMGGYWVLNAPGGYKYEKASGHGKILVRDEPVASIIQEALENFAIGRFESPMEVKHFLDSQPGFPKNYLGEVHLQRVLDMLNRVLYTGYLEYPKWGIRLTRGHHEPIISMETYKRIQDRLKGKAKAPIRKDINLDFPLRGFVLCSCCQRPFTASWSQGRTAKYAYYFCCNKECAKKGKSIRREVMEVHFKQILLDLHPLPGIYPITRRVMENCWRQTVKERNAMLGNLSTELHRVERRIGQFLGHIAEADFTMTGLYEDQIRKLEARKTILSDEIAKHGKVTEDFESSLISVCEFLESPYKLWDSEDIINKRLALKLVFAERLSYHQNLGFQNAALSRPFAFGAKNPITADLEAPGMADGEKEELANAIYLVGKNILARKFGLFQPDYSRVKIC